MARPRIFVSSTFYDLRHVRGEIERFIQGMGYDPVLNERGNIAYETKEALETYCYKEIEKVSMLVSIIGNRFGSTSRENENYSVSNMEIKTAIKQGKQVYIFVDKGVQSDYRTYLKNKGKDISYHHVDDIRIFQFLEEVYSLPSNNQVFGFESIAEVIAYLKEQWAGLLEIYLQSQGQEKINQVSDTIKSTAETLKELVELLRNERSGLQDVVHGREKALDAIIVQNHPVFNRLRTLTGAPYRIFFTSKEEMDVWLKARQWEPVVKEAWDSESDREYIRDGKSSSQTLLYVSEQLFDVDGRLRMMLPGEWDANFVRTKTLKADQPPPRSPRQPPDDIPF
jgi:hypothetical protein